MSRFRHGLPAGGALPDSHLRLRGGCASHVDILRPGSLEALWFSTVRVPARQDGNPGSRVDNRHCSNSKPGEFQR